MNSTLTMMVSAWRVEGFTGTSTPYRVPTAPLMTAVRSCPAWSWSALVSMTLSAVINSFQNNEMCLTSEAHDASRYLHR